ncbi:MAG: hypBA2 [Planctomycetota bacterium]|nr:hypBA2 [Planctomycetota bacterium]
MIASLLVILSVVFRPQDAVAPVEFKVVAPPKDAKFSPFYKKSISVGDLPIRSSEHVSDFALFEAAYLIREMLAERPDVLSAMSKNGVRFSVMAPTERTTDIPEHADLVPSRYWDRRARGLGGPLVSCGEENLLNYRGDPYGTENVLIHEFAHGVHNFGISKVDPTFNPRLGLAYKTAIAKGLWKGTYAATNVEEYWAEGVQSWFDTNRHDDHDHNHVDTREELEAYDPGLFSLITETFRRTDWRYTRPDRRAERGHLAGLDLAKSPAFAWDRDGEAGRGPVLDKRAMLGRQTFWDNRDWDWYAKNIPFLETPDKEIDTTYYYRWELLTKHLTYGSTGSGYSFTEFIDRPFWSGAYGAISCPAGHQLYESRWVRQPTIARDYAKYWLQTPGAQPRNYSTWLADSVWAVHMVHPDEAFTRSLKDGLIKNYEGWERDHFDPKAGLFFQSGHDDGMEYNINSRQTKDILRGDSGFRPTLNSYLWADAKAISAIAKLDGDGPAAARFDTKAADLKKNLQQKLWDDRRGFYFPMSRRDEDREGFTVKAGSLTYETGKFASNEHGRELIGYVPWQFNLPDPGRESSWKFLMDPDYFLADYGPTVTERHDPQFLVAKTCCWWSGQSWPYATTQTLVAMANLLNNYKQDVVSKSDHVKLLKIYTRTHRKSGKPYIAEGADPDTGSWEGYDSPGHSDHYFHSGYNDLIITGLIGLRPRSDDVIEVNPLAPEDWGYFALDDVSYHGRRVSIVWDRDGTKYGLGPGLRILADGKTIASSPKLGKLTADLPPATQETARPPAINYAVNNDGTMYPRATASFTSADTSVAKAIDGNSWYHVKPSNRWTTAGSPNATDWFAVDFGTRRPVHTVGLYLLDDDDVAHDPNDRNRIARPSSIALEFWDGDSWKTVPDQVRTPDRPEGHRANWIAFPPIQTSRIRAVFHHRESRKTGLTEFEAWGEGRPPIAPAPSPPGNLAANPKATGFPKAEASFTSRFDKVDEANDGIVRLTPNPRNRWTCYESPNAEDWLSLDFGHEETVGRLDLHLFDDGGGVRAPKSYTVQTWDGKDWHDVLSPTKDPETPAGRTVNIVTFPPIKTSKVRVVFTHRDGSKSGVTEIEVRENSGRNRR